MRTNQKVLFSLVLLLSFKLQAQLPDTDIWLFDLSDEKGKFTLSHPVNISDRDGYDNQPVFSPDGKYILYTSYRKNGQSDIMKYEIETKMTKAFCHTQESEYSPAFTPDGKFVSVVRVEKDSVQRLWKFPVEGGRPVLVFKNIDSIGYQSWIDTGNVALFRLGNPEKLYSANIHKDSKQDLEFIAAHIGRTFHELIFVSKADTANWQISLPGDPYYGIPFLDFAPCMKGKEDFDLYQEKVIFMGSGSQLFCYPMPFAKVNMYGWEQRGKRTWTLVADLSKQGLKNITRMAISKDGKKIALVSTK